LLPLFLLFSTKILIFFASRRDIIKAQKALKSFYLTELGVRNLKKELIKAAATGIVPKDLKPYVKPALEKFKNEMAAELGMPDYDTMDKGELPSRMNGKVGGNMTHKMVSFAEAVLAWNYRKQLESGKNEEGADT